MMPDEKIAIVFLGSVVPEDICNRNPACSVAGNKFQIQFLEALRASSGVSPFVFTILPVGTFPKSRTIFVPSDPITLKNEIEGWLIPFVNVLILKQLTMGCSILCYLVRWLWQHRRKRCFVFVCNVYPPMSVPALLAKYFMGGKAVAVVPDFPHNLSFNFQGLKGVLQRINVWLESHCLIHFDGIIPFTQYIVEDFAPGRPMLVMEGGVDPADVKPKLKISNMPSMEKICFFSGVLNSINGIDLLLKAFSLIPDPDYRLWIFGKGPLESAVRVAELQDKRIVYGGFLPNVEVMRLQKQATVLLNARPTDQLITRYTFPSKLREYMLSGRPVITTALPGIPKDYLDCVYVLSEETPEGLARLLRYVCVKPAFELAEFGSRAREFILQTRNWSIQGRRVYEFICKL